MNDILIDATTGRGAVAATEARATRRVAGLTSGRRHAEPVPAAMRTARAERIAGGWRLAWTLTQARGDGQFQDRFGGR